MKKIHIISFIICFLCTTVNAQVITQVYDPDIATLRVMYLGTDNVERPFLVLGGDEVLDISFDELSHDTHLYSYTLIHLNHDGSQSSLMSSEYINGYANLEITDYEHSQLTHQLYTHYRFEFPNEDMQPKVSGSYMIQIYEDNNPDKTVAAVFLQVAEQNIEITSNIRGNTDIEFNQRLQQVDIDIDLKKNDLQRPEDITVTVIQNNRLDNAVVLSKPTFINGNKVRYANNRQLIFEGGNEYRRFDISSEYIKGRNVDRIDFDREHFHAFLFADENRASTPYIYEPDADGQWIINAERRDDDDYEADYMFVHFLLPCPAPKFEGSPYIVGDLFNNQLATHTRMEYDNEHKCYTYTAYLKQGAYEYQYLFLEKGKTKATTSTFEGSSWQTENEYTISVYYHPFGARYDRLLGRLTVKSR